MKYFVCWKFMVSIEIGPAAKKIFFLILWKETSIITTIRQFTVHLLLSNTKSIDKSPAHLYHTNAYTYGFVHKCILNKLKCTMVAKHFINCSFCLFGDWSELRRNPKMFIIPRQIEYRIAKYYWHIWIITLRFDLCKFFENCKCMQHDATAWNLLVFCSRWFHYIFFLSIFSHFADK